MIASCASTLAVVATLSSLAKLAPTADAHQIVLLPEPQWTMNDKETKYNPLAFLENEGFTTQEDFTAWRKENGYKSLRDFMDNAKYPVTSGADFYCGLRRSLFQRATPCAPRVTPTTARVRCGSTTRWCLRATTVTRSFLARTTRWTTHRARERARFVGSGLVCVS
ncbi:unnamed protein product [Phytophthora fragariaefolia]|uniref:Unnamed protein product n=1 Tax=Phytophthora fragariaefolia TaxID=1490495 RepID=A0A9W6YDW8_9STRA|nr:unnamed protein product [Phytophthora fragariaefolia]